MRHHLTLLLVGAALSCSAVARAGGADGGAEADTTAANGPVIASGATLPSEKRVAASNEPPSRVAAPEPAAPPAASGGDGVIGLGLLGAGAITAAVAATIANSNTADDANGPRATYEVVAVTGYAVGIVALAGMTYLLAQRLGEEPAAPSVAVVPRVGPSEGGASLVGHF